MKYWLIKKIVHTLDRIIPKKRNLIVFGARGGTKYYDNSRYFFEWMLENHPEFELVWLHLKNLQITLHLIDSKISSELSQCYTDSDVSLDKLRRVFHFRQIRSFHGLWVFLRAKTVVMSHGYGDFDFCLGKKSPKRKIMLWHGTPIKKIMFASDYRKPKERQKFDLFTVNSRLEQYLFTYSFRLRDGVAQITGTPRSDILLTNLCKYQDSDKEKFLRNLGFRYHAGAVEKIILYAPTYREEKQKKKPLIRYEKLADFLEKHNAVIIERLHINDAHSIEPDPFRSYQDKRINPRLITLDQKDYADVTDFLHLVDILITDYSSIYFDFILLNRPILLVPYDLKEYEAKWGFNFSYHHLVEGDLIETGDQLISALEIFFDDPKLNSQRRSCIRGLFYDIADTGACERIYNWIEANTY